MRYYWLCRSCRTLSGPVTGLAPVKPKCCARPGVEQWPSRDALRLLEIAGQETAKGVDGRRVTTVFLAFALERLLEDTLRFILRSGDVLPPRVPERKMFFARRTGHSIAGVLKGSGLATFNDSWDELIKLRNQIAHGQFFLARTMNLSVLRDIRRDALPAFEALMRVSLTAGQPTRSKTFSLGSGGGRAR